MSADSVTCSRCGSEVERGELRGHLSAHLHYHPFQCGRCFSRFLSRNKLGLHAQIYHNSLPLDVLEDPDSAKEEELRQLMESSSTTDTPAPLEIPTENEIVRPLAGVPMPPQLLPQSPVVPSPPPVVAASKGAEAISVTPLSYKRKTPTRSSSRKKAVKIMNNAGLKKEKCGLCGELWAVNNKHTHLGYHVRRILDGEEESPHVGKPSGEIYLAIRLLCFPDTNSWLGTSRKKTPNAASSDEEEENTEEKDEIKTKTSKKFGKCGKCGDTVYKSSKPRHCKQHVTELMIELRQDPRDQDKFNQHYFAKRMEWFPGTRWKEKEPECSVTQSEARQDSAEAGPRKDAQLQHSRTRPPHNCLDEPRTPRHLRILNCQKCGQMETRSKPFHCKQHVTELMMELGQDPTDLEQFNRHFFAKRNEWFPGTVWKQKEPKPPVTQSETREVNAEDGPRKDGQLQPNSTRPPRSGQGDSSSGLGSSESGEQQVLDDDDLAVLLLESESNVTQGNQQLLNIKLEPQEAGKDNSSAAPSRDCSLCGVSVALAERDVHVWRLHCDGRRPFGCISCPFHTEDFPSAQAHVTQGHSGAQLSFDNTAHLLFADRCRACFPALH